MSDDLLPQTSGVNPPPTPAEPILVPLPSANGTAAPVDGAVSAGATESRDVTESPDATDSVDGPGAAPRRNPDGTPRPRRRRGSRGGRNRKRPTGPRSASADDATADDGESEGDTDATS